MLYCGLEGLQAALDALMRTDIDSGASFMHAHVMPNVSIVFVVASLCRFVIPSSQVRSLQK